MSSHAQKLMLRRTPELVDTRNELPATARQAAVRLLGGLVAEVLDASMCARHARWNLRAPNVMALRTLLDEVSTGLMQQADALAERVTALGGSAPGTPQLVVTETTLKPYPSHRMTAHEHLDALATRIGLLSAEARISGAECSDLGDPVTVHTLTEAHAAFDRLLWLVESHLVRTH